MKLDLSAFSYTSSLVPEDDFISKKIEKQSET